MGLTLSFVQGDSFRLQDDKYTISEIESANRFLVTGENSSHWVTSESPIELSHGVWVRSGYGTIFQVRINFVPPTPKEVSIHREKIYQRIKAQQ